MPLRANWRQEAEDAERAKQPITPDHVTAFIETFIETHPNLSADEAPRVAYHAAMLVGLGRWWAAHVEVQVRGIVRTRAGAA